ncbi:MAG: hypothetical protein ACFCVC_03625 [Acidimicrobiia bacterium]
MNRRLAATAALSAVLVLVPAGSALADPPGPTEYRTEVVSIEPPVEALQIEVIGGDTFLQMTVATGTTVDVVGYQGEPFLRFLPDGIVEVNENSPTTYLSDDRYGDVELPPNADPAAEPAWLQVSSDGSYSWHDHRSHWMNPDPPPGGARGEQILEAVVPIVVDGEAVAITVISSWEQAASPAPAIAGGVVAIALVALFRSRGTRAMGLVLGGIALLAAVVGLVAYFSVPTETAPSVVPWAVAAVALLPLATVLRFPAEQPPLSLVVISMVLAVWGVLRWDWMWSAILPTSLPIVDRFATGLVLMAGVGFTALLVWKRLTNPTPT